MYGYNYGYYYFDWTYLLIILAFIISLIVSVTMNSTFSKYSKVLSMCGMTGAEAARKILDSEGLYNVVVQPISGNLTDHYDPRNKTVSLSQPVYGRRSLAALGVAAHECGHAIQDAKEYAPLRMRSALVPVANFGSQSSWIVFFLGLIFSSRLLCEIGIFLFCFALIFQLVTLPVEFNASHRALGKLEGLGILTRDENKGARKVLTAAAMTYVASVCTSLLYLLRMIVLSRGSRDRR
ncbi:MAG: zinc metallopeptidase [Eubacteriales bacterium]|jgi:Zn-dependent membrane protease YugP